LAKVSLDLKNINLLEYYIFKGKIESINLKEKKIINTINQYSFCIAENDPDFKKALQKSDILLPDGIAIVQAIKLLKKEKIKKIAGADIHNYLLEELNKVNGRCFYMGSKNSTLNKIKERIAKEYPNIQISTYSPPYKDKFTKDENQIIVEQINNFEPQVVFVGMTAPKQEKWVHQIHEELNTNIICSIGAVFDFYAGTIDRPHKIWINLGLEWFARLIKEPKRMWKRYLYYGPVFIAKILKAKLNYSKNKILPIFVD
jgi:N-acetylglucosaminyldiphosphoundecaprenol N-acetyl-beta-D-mannosaminyltransferase